MQLYIISVMSILHTCTAPLMTKDLQAPATLIGTLVQLRANTANYVVAAPCRHGQVQNEHHKRQSIRVNSVSGRLKDLFSRVPEVFFRLLFLKKIINKDSIF